MNDDKFMMIVKESFFKKIFSRIKSLFTKNNEKKAYDKVSTEENMIKIDSKLDDLNKKAEFVENIKVEQNSDIIYLKRKLESGEVRAIDLTDEQIDELQKIYDKEILEKQNKLKRLKGVA